MEPAFTIFYYFNSNAVCGFDFEEGKQIAVMIEDHADPDGRQYRLEYRSTLEGDRAVSICRYSPWGEFCANEMLDAHVNVLGELCLGTHATGDVHNSPYDLPFTIMRSRYWCFGYSYYREHGTFPQL